MTEPRDPLLTLVRYTNRLRQAGVSKTAIVSDLLYAAAGIALVDGADRTAFITAAAMTWRRLVAALNEKKGGS